MSAKKKVRRVSKTSRAARKREAPRGGTGGRGARGARKRGRTRPSRGGAKPRSGTGAGGDRAALSPQLARRLLGLEEAIRQRIIGKDEAVARVARVIRVRMTELDFRPGRPKGSFLLVGPTGVGKNELAYALAEALYGGDVPVVSIDLAELAEEGDLAKLAATPVPGSENRYSEGLLTSPVRVNPQAVVLLRGLERAHASFHPLLQQILERGRLEDMLGEVDFSRTVLFVTSRPRRDDASPAEIGFSRTPLPAAEALHKRLERSLPSELLDAFNEIIELPPLTAGDVRRIARYKVEAVLGRLESRSRSVQVADEVYEAFLPEDELRQHGVSVLQRTLEDRLFNPLAVYLLSHRGRRPIRVEMEAGDLRIREGPAARPGT
jgi:ATP-dependent Clp protease ATP-binding subunit ClpC